MERAQLVINDDGLVVNRIVTDETTPNDFNPGPGLTMLPHTVEGVIGGTYKNGVYTPPEPEETESEA